MIRDNHKWVGLGWLRYCKGCGWLQIKEVHKAENIMTMTIWRDFNEDLSDDWMTPEIQLQVSKELLTYLEVCEEKGWNL